MGGRRIPPRGGRLILLVIAAAVALSGCGESGTAHEAGAAKPMVVVKTFMFDPDPLVVEPGTTVTWANQDATVHTVTTGRRGRPTGLVDAKLAPSGGRFTTTFKEPGTFRYFCSRHSGPGMEAKVIVRPPGN